MIEADPVLAAPLHPDFPDQLVDVAYAVRHEMAITAEDVLARRTRLLFLDAQAALDCLEMVVAFMQEELNESDEWATRQEKDFRALAEGYL